MEAKVVEAPSGVAGCSQQDVELLASQIWVVSQSAVQLPLQIEDASRPEKAEVGTASTQHSSIFISHSFRFFSSVPFSARLRGILNYQTSRFSLCHLILNIELLFGTLCIHNILTDPILLCFVVIFID